MKIKSKVRGGPRGCGGAGSPLPNTDIPLRSVASSGLAGRDHPGESRARGWGGEREVGGKDPSSSAEHCRLCCLTAPPWGRVLSRSAWFRFW
jgi:hypothetical protein